MNLRKTICWAAIAFAAVLSARGEKDMPKLRWVDDDKARIAESNVVMKILREDKSLSYGDPNSGNILVHGDNLEALKALLPFYAGRVKCIFIDPPYNTGSAFEHYDDNLEQSIWLSLMYPRLKLLREFLTEDGSIYVCIDFNQTHHLRDLMDEIFGTKCFQREIIWRIGWLSGFKTAANNYIRNHDTLLYYTKNSSGFYFNKEVAYNQPDDYLERFNGAAKKEIEERLINEGLSKAKAKELFDFLSKVGLPERYPLEDTWNCSSYDKLNSIAVVSFSGEKVSKMLGTAEFKGQKAEALIRRVLRISTKPGDIVMDSFLGTGSTAAVAQKMGRRWIGIEIGNQAYEMAAPRLRKVINGEDNSGVTPIEKWQGGGGFKFYELGEPLLDENGAISEGIDFDMLAAHIWWRETGSAWDVATRNGTFLGVHNGVAYAMLYNGVLHDRSYAGGNVLTPKTMRIIREDIGEAKYSRLVVYGECTKLGAAKLREENVEFRQTPYDIVTRR